MLTSWFYFDAFKTTLIKVFTNLYQNANMLVSWGATIAQWIRLRLPSCRPGFESQACHLRFFIYLCYICHVKRTKINKKRPGLAHLKNMLVSIQYILLQMTSAMKKTASRATFITVTLSSNPSGG